MDIQEPPTTFGTFTYSQTSFKELADHLNEVKGDENHHLCLFLGVYEPDKKKALQQLAQTTGLDIQSISFNDLVSKSESETYEKLDGFFAEYNKENSILYFTEGDKLCGVYTGFTHSRVKYATPQERYFLRKVQAYEGIVVVDISEFAAADKTIRRAAQSIVEFVLPKSKLQRFFWHLKNYSLHGYDLKSKRPEAYGDIAINT